MSRITTKTALANLAASLLKADAVTSIDPPDTRNKTSSVMARWYDETRRQVLEEHPWHFAVKRAQIASAGDVPAFGWDVSYTMPADCLRIISIGDEDDPIKGDDYEIEGGMLLCNEDAPLNIRYVYDLENVTLFSPAFIRCFSIRLAQNAAYDITGNRNAVADLETLYEKALSDAKVNNAIQNPPRRIHRSKWKRAKETGSVGGMF